MESYSMERLSPLKNTLQSIYQHKVDTRSFITFCVTSRLCFLPSVSHRSACCLFKLCSLQHTDCMGHFYARNCEHTTVSLYVSAHCWRKTLDILKIKGITEQRFHSFLQYNNSYIWIIIMGSIGNVLKILKCVSFFIKWPCLNVMVS